MAAKTCPSCNQQSPNATKVCSCGHVFLNKTSKKDTEVNQHEQQQFESNQESNETQKRCDGDLQEDFESFKTSQIVVHDKIDSTLADLIADYNDLKKDQKACSSRIDEEISNVKEYIRITISEATENLETKYSNIIDVQNQRILSLETLIETLRSRITELENSDPDTDSDSDDDEITQETNIPTENRFSPLQNNEVNDSSDSHPQQEAPRYQGNNSQTDPERVDSHNNHDEIGQSTKKILILSDSMMRRIDERRLSQQSEITKKYIRGGTEEMKQFINTFDEDNITTFDKIVIHTGTNDIFRLQNDAIINNIRETYETCKSKWINSEIIISSIMHHKLNTFQNDVVDTINKGFLRVCEDDNATFMNNDHITKARDGTIDSEVYYDNIHLNDSKGLRKLAANLIKHLKLRSQNRENTGHSAPKRSDWRFNRNNQRKRPWQYNNSRNDIYREHPRNMRSFGFESTRGNNPPTRQDHMQGQFGGLLAAIKPLADWISTLPFQ